MSKIVGINGVVADVNPLNQLLVSSVSKAAAEELNLQGFVFSVYASVTPAGADDYFIYFTNTGTASVAIGSWEATSTVPTCIEMDVVTGTPSYIGAGDANVVNMNLGSASPLQVDAKVDTDITGLTSEGTLSTIECAIANTQYEKNIASAIIIPQGKALAIKRVEATGQVDIRFRVGTITQ